MDSAYQTGWSCPAKEIITQAVTDAYPPLANSLQGNCVEVVCALALSSSVCQSCCVRMQFLSNQIRQFQTMALEIKLLVTNIHGDGTDPKVPAHTVMTVHLTSCERTVLALAASGMTMKQIAEELVISDTTVKSHLQSIYRKLDASNRTQAVDLAHKLGLLP